MDIEQREKYKYAILYKVQKYGICVNSIDLEYIDAKSDMYSAEILLSDKYDTKRICLQFSNVIELINLLDDEIHKFMVGSLYIRLNEDNYGFQRV